MQSTANPTTVLREVAQNGDVVQNGDVGFGGAFTRVVVIVVAVIAVSASGTGTATADPFGWPSGPGFVADGQDHWYCISSNASGSATT